MNVNIVWGGWSCNAGYIKWAYVCEVREIPEWAKGKVVDGVSDEDITSIGKKVFEPPNSLNGENEDPKEKCKEWCKENMHNIKGYVKLGTD